MGKLKGPRGNDFLLLSWDPPLPYIHLIEQIMYVLLVEVKDLTVLYRLPAQ